MIDKRFFSGAILVVTIVVAGASSLPALLLRPAAPDTLPMPVAAPAAVTTAEPIERVEAKPVEANVEPKPIAKPAAVMPDPPPVAVPPTKSVAVPPPPSTPAAEPPPPVREAAPITFPAVQPVGVAAASGPDAVAAPAASAPARAATATGKPRQRTAHQTAARKRAVRPAIFPLREFLAWRR